ncbi:MAG: hypothetical protein V2A76_16845, partial [Planctomycetota bacterium]
MQLTSPSNSIPRLCSPVHRRAVLLLTSCLIPLLFLAGCHAPAAGSVAASALETRLQAVLDRFLAENPSAPGVSAYVECPSLGLEWFGAAGTVAKDSV